MMADSLSINFDSSPKFELSTEQAYKTTHKVEHSSSSIQKAIAEFVSLGCGAALANERLQITIVGIAIPSGLALTVAIYSVGHVSGGHFNPAVTIALAAVRKVQLKLMPIYVLCQLMGATLATLTLKVLSHDKVDIGVTVT